MTSNKITNKKEYKIKCKENKKYSKNKTLNKDYPKLTELDNNICIRATDAWKIIANEDKKYNIVKGINLDIYKGEIIMIFGESGSGKTSLISLLSGLERPSEGNVNILGYNTSCMKTNELVSLRYKYIGYVFQQYGLLRDVNVLENIIISINSKERQNILKILKKYKKEAKIIKNENNYSNEELKIKLQDLRDELFKDQYIYNISKQLELDDLWEHKTNNLSGGQQQRISIARAISKKPAILFADEPTGAVDDYSAKSIMSLFIMMNSVYKTTIIIVTHNNKLIPLSNKIITIVDGNINKISNNEQVIDIAKIEFE